MTAVFSVDKLVRSMVAKGGDGASVQGGTSGALKREERFRPISNGRRTQQTQSVILRELASLGAPPKDPLEAQVWAFEALSASMFHIMNDKELDEKTRRKEMRETARVMRELMPMKRLANAEAAVKGETAKALGEDGGPTMQPAAPLAKKSKRGRPAKRG